MSESGRGEVVSEMPQASFLSLQVHVGVLLGTCFFLEHSR